MVNFLGTRSGGRSLLVELLSVVGDGLKLLTPQELDKEIPRVLGRQLINERTVCETSSSSSSVVGS